MADPLTWTVVGSTVVVEGIKFLYGQMTEVMKRLAAKKEKPAEVAAPFAPVALPAPFAQEGETRQAIGNDPYRSVSPAYFELNALAELRFGGIAVFLNAINLTNVRQTHYDPLIRVIRGPGGDPITDVWAPLDGRIFNLGIRAEL